MELDGDPVRGVGDGPGQAADDGLAGDGAVFVVVAEVGVEVARQPVLGVVREQPQHHLQAAAAASSLVRAAVIFFSAAGISVEFLAAGLIAGSASMAARSRSAAASAFSASRTSAVAFLRAGLSVILVFVSMLAM